MKRDFFDYTHEEMLEMLVKKKLEKGELDPPAPTYTEEEIQQFEHHIGDSLPLDFRDYLLNVSREMCLDYYPNVVNLIKEGKCCLCDSSDLSKQCTQSKSNIPLKMNSWIHYFGPKMKDGKVVQEEKPRRPTCQLCKEEYHGNCNKCGINNYKGMIEIAFGGCTNFYRIIISGESKGTIWYEWDECSQKVANSFSEYYDKSIY